MLYEVNLYAKICNKYPKMTITTKEVDALASQLKRMVRYYEAGETRPEAVAKIRDAKEAINNAGLAI